MGDITKRDVSGWWGNTGEGTREKMVLEFLPGSRKSRNGWHSNLFQMAEARMGMIWIAVFPVEKHIDKEEVVIGSAHTVE